LRRQKQSNSDIQWPGLYWQFETTAALPHEQFRRFCWLPSNQFGDAER